MTPRFSDSPSMDMVAVVDLVCARLEALGNHKPLYAVGGSAGANAIALHCAHTGPQCKLDAFVSISNPYDIHATLGVKLKTGIVARNVYDPFFVPKRLSVVKSHPHLFEKLPGFDMKKVEASRGAIEFDIAAVVPATQEFDSVNDFYRARSSGFHLEKICVPGLLINAEDDPFVMISTLDEDAVRRNENLFVVITERGGHWGFVDGILGGVGTKTWDERLTDLYLSYMTSITKIPRREKTQ